MTDWRNLLLDSVTKGDPAAWETLRRVLPDRLPGRERQRLRDDRMRELALILRAHFHGEARSTIAALIHMAGAALESGDPLPGVPFQGLDTDLDRFVDLITGTLPILITEPRTGRRWPCERTIRAAID